MRGWGIALVIVGFIGLIAGMVMDTSVTSGLSRIENIGLLSRQTSILTVSALAFLTGCVLIGFAAVCDAIQRLGPAIASHMPRAPVPQPLPQVRPLPPAMAEAAGVSEGMMARQIGVGSRVKNPSFGEGMVLSVDGETSRVKFETIDQPMTINTAALAIVRG